MNKEISVQNSCTCFFLQFDDSLLLAREILCQYKIPAVFITSLPSGVSKIAGSKIYCLDELYGGEGASGG
jgi:hypothetical protein